MVTYISISIFVFVIVTVIVQSKYFVLRCIPYILFIYLLLFFFENSSHLFKIILFAVLLMASLILALYEDYQKEN